jgi:hypothetical protein
VAVFSGSETNEQAAAISRLVRQGLRSDLAILPDEPVPALDAYRAPLSAIASAEICLVVGDHPVVERAPIVELWLRAARRAGAEVITVHAAGSVQVAPGAAAWVCAELSSSNPSTDELHAVGRKLRAADRVALVWSEDDPTGGAHLAGLASALELADGSGAYWLPSTPNGVGVAAAWHAAGKGRGTEPPAGAEVGALIVSGDEALRDPRVIELADRASCVISTSMFMTEVTGQSTVVIPGTGYLERDGTATNLEGRTQRLRRSIPYGGWDEQEFFARLAQRFRVDISLSPSVATGKQAPLPARPAPENTTPVAAVAPAPDGGGLELLRYRSLFSGAAVERIPQLQFQRPVAEIELAAADARERSLRTGDPVIVTSNGTSRTLTTRVNRRLIPGVARVAEEHANGLAQRVEVVRAP